MTTNEVAICPPGGDKMSQHPVSPDVSQREPESRINDGDPLISEKKPAMKQPVIILKHKIRVKSKLSDWLCFAAYALGMYGFMVLMIVLLLKATKKDSQAVGITYFSVFMFFMAALLAVVFAFQRRMKKQLETERRSPKGSATT